MKNKNLNYMAIVKAIIATYDDEISNEEHSELVNKLNPNEKNIYYGLTFRMSDETIMVEITTVDSRKTKQNKKQIKEVI